MIPYLKSVVLFAVVIGLYAPATAAADFRDYNDKAWTQAGRQRSPSAMRSRAVFRSAAPVIVRTEPAPATVAQAPTGQRSFSYEPSQAAQEVAPSGCGCPCGVVGAEPAPATAQRPTESRRSFSYEPSTADSYTAPSGPRMGSRPMRSQRTPTYLLPKTDSRRFSGR